MDQTLFATRLQEAMDSKGLKRADLLNLASAQGTKLGKSQLSQYLSGKTIPRSGMIAFLAQALEVADDWLAGTDEPALASDATDKDSKHRTDQVIGTTLEVAPMRKFDKSSKLDHVSYDVRGPALDEAMRMEEDGINILKLNIGNPAPFGFHTPDEVIQDMASQLRDTEGYSDSRGLFAVPSPDYPLWTACVTLAGGKAVHYLCDEQADWLPDLDDMRAKITSNTKAIVIINPNNPTGALYPREVLEEIVEIARQNQLIILSDEIYDRLVMDGEEHVSIASLAPDLFCITFNGLSKSHMIAGWRIGWISISGNKRLGKGLMEGIHMMSNMRLCSNVPAQSIVQTALGGYQSVKNYVVPTGRVCKQRDFVYERLCAMDGVSVVKPKAAFYIFPKLDPKKFNITDDEQFQLDLLQDKRVLIVPGKGFNWETPGYFRIVYLPRRAVLGEALDQLEDFLKYYRQ